MPDAPWICDPCKAGKHAHDRWPETGADAGCPRALWEGGAMVAGPCACPAVVHQGAPRRCPTCGRPQ